MTVSPGVFIEWYDDEVTLAEVSDTEFFEIYDGSITVRSYTVSAEFTMIGPLFTKVGTGGYPIHPGVWRIASIEARVVTASGGQSVIVDINKNGVSIFAIAGNRPTIAAGSQLAVTGAWTEVSFTHGDSLTVDVDQVGSPGTEGDTLVVSILLERTA
jgi:hypothetical protein